MDGYTGNTSSYEGYKDRDLGDLSSKDIEEIEERRQDAFERAGINEEEEICASKEDLNIWSSYFQENIRRGRDDANFSIREQWNSIEDSEFNRLGKWPLTFNKMHDNIKKLIGEDRDNHPDMIVRSLNGKATQEQIDLRADIVRTIAYQSQSQLVYQTAFRSALTSSFGAFQVDIDFESDRSFNKIIKLCAIPDATQTGFDPNARLPHKGDGNFYYRLYQMSLREFFAQFPNVDHAQSYSNITENVDYTWFNGVKDSIIVLDRYVKKWFPIKLYLLSTGQSVSESEWEEMQEEIKIKTEIMRSTQVVSKMIEDQIPKIVAERITKTYKIMHFRQTHDQILNFREWPSKYLPGIFMDGDSYYIDGRQYTKSFISGAKDAQKALNFVNSEIVTELKNRRREQWLVTPDNIQGHEPMWKNPENQYGAMIAKPDPITKQMPQKMPAWEIPQTFIALAQKFDQDIREIMGYTETQHLQARDTSGIAKKERRLEASASAAVYFDNRNQAVEQAGRVILDLLPYVYKEENRNFILSKRDGQSRNITLNKTLSNNKVENEITAGDFDLEIDSGPSFAVQKETAMELLSQLIGLMPQEILPLVADLYAKNLDVQFMPQLVERLQNLVPPQILAKEQGKPAPPPQPNPQQQMMQQQMQMQQQEMKMKGAQIQQKQAEIQLKQQQQQMDQVKIQLDAKKLYEDLAMNQEDQTVEKMKMMVELKRIMEDSHTSDKDRLVDLHKSHLDHHHKMASLIQTENSSE